MMKKALVFLFLSVLCVLGLRVEAAVPSNDELAKMSSTKLLTAMRAMSNSELKQLVQQVSGRTTDSNVAASATVRSRVATNLAKILQAMTKANATACLKEIQTDTPELVVSVSVRGNYSCTIKTYSDVENPVDNSGGYVPRPGNSTTISEGTHNNS